MIKIDEVFTVKKYAHKTVMMVRVDKVNQMVGYALTCRKNNTKEWMNGFAERLNKYFEDIGDDDRYKFNGDCLEQD